MTRYYVDISTTLVDEILMDDSGLPEGWRLVACVSTNATTGVDRWHVEDSHADISLEGKLVGLVFWRVDTERAEITKRYVRGQD
jgi:hypothetical protein